MWHALSLQVQASMDMHCLWSCRKAVMHKTSFVWLQSTSIAKWSKGTDTTYCLYQARLCTFELRESVATEQRVTSASCGQLGLCSTV